MKSYSLKRNKNDKKGQVDWNKKTWEGISVSFHRVKLGTYGCQLLAQSVHGLSKFCGVVTGVPGVQTRKTLCQFSTVWQSEVHSRRDFISVVGGKRNRL